MRQSAVDMSSELAATELAALKSFLQSAHLKGRHLEIGTAAGGTLKELMLAYERPRPRFIAVDTFRYFPNQREIVESNLKSAGLELAEVELRARSSEQALRAAIDAGERFDLIFIDANHEARHVIRDLRWAALLSEGGALCLHDYSPRFPGVVWAVGRFLGRNGNYRRVGLTDSLLILQKFSPDTDRIVGAFDTLIADVLSQVHRLRRSLRKRLGRPV
jgi:predicted O-methyltransferase YrrM